ncbi:Similar to Mlc1: Myosin light chain alkali (Drosophila melanogaster) [Cotesia congregata]|uniref:Myosin light chain alkali n=1 Tax=Cotesia congregata TaxID=51543 RepID=A0A8J2H5S4_COTCN|nr:Similar to Mlc1: Myosin light chain alkali (Drosophila melanogaster) [Cotesia congregata]
MSLVPEPRISGSYFVQLTSRSRHISYSNGAEFCFSIYDADGTNVIDAVDLGNVLRALNLNPTNAAIERLGGTTKRGEKKITVEEFLPIFEQAKTDKDQGGYEDFLECLKLYDKQENGTMLGVELSNMLLTVGEKLEDAQVEEVLGECMDPEDEDGFIPYAREKLEDAQVEEVLGECMDPEDEDGFIPYAPFLRRLCERAAAEAE